MFCYFPLTRSQIHSNVHRQQFHFWAHIKYFCCHGCKAIWDFWDRAAEKGGMSGCVKPILGLALKGDSWVCLTMSMAALEWNACWWKHPRMLIWWVALSSKSVWEGQDSLSGGWVPCASKNFCLLGAGPQVVGKRIVNSLLSLGKEAWPELCVCWNEFVQDHETLILDLLLTIATSSWGRGARKTCFISNSDFDPIFLSGVIPEALGWVICEQ